MFNSMSFLPHQGRFIRIYNEAKTLVDNGFDVTLLVWDREAKHPKKEIRDGIKVERIWIKGGVEKGPLLNGIKVLWFNLLAFLNAMSRDFDIIHCFNLDTIPAGYLAAKLKRKKMVLDLCEPEYYAFWKGVFSPLVNVIRWIEKGFSKRFDYVLCHNLYQLRKFKGYGINHVEQIGTFPNNTIIVNEVGQKNNICDDYLVIGRIGTIYKDNGIEETVAAFQQLLKVYNTKVRLFLAGRVYENYHPTFQDLIGSLTDKVDIIGAFSGSEMPEFYKKIDISVILNRTNSNWFRHITPTKLFDSLAHGVPVVASDIGDVREILETYNCGIIVDETNPDEVANAINKIALDPDLRISMAQNGLKLIKEKYNWNYMAKKLLEIYKGL